MFVTRVPSTRRPDSSSIGSPRRVKVILFSDDSVGLETGAAVAAANGLVSRGHQVLTDRFHDRCDSFTWSAFHSRWIASPFVCLLDLRFEVPGLCDRGLTSRTCPIAGAARFAFGSCEKVSVLPCANESCARLECLSILTTTPAVLNQDALGKELRRQKGLMRREEMLLKRQKQLEAERIHRANAFIVCPCFLPFPIASAIITL